MINYLVQTNTIQYTISKNDIKNAIHETNIKKIQIHKIHTNITIKRYVQKF